MFNISSCTSQDSTAIISSTTNQPSVLPSSFSSSSSSTLVSGGRGLDKHNPLITDEKRSGVIISKSHSNNHLLQHKPKKPTLNSPTPLKNKTNNTKKNTSVEIIENHDNGHKKVGRKSFSKPSDMIKKVTACNTSKAGVDYITPQESSSRYLLGDTSFLDGFSESSRSSINNDAEVSKFDAPSKLPTKHSCSSAGISDQVVVLRVSLHCRGCEKKLEKHLSRMPGVTSFNIDFVAKKVTVVGDVTPVQVISSITKVKTANLWSTTIPSSTHISTRNMETRKQSY